MTTDLLLLPSPYITTYTVCSIGPPLNFYIFTHSLQDYKYNDPFALRSLPLNQSRLPTVTPKSTSPTIPEILSDSCCGIWVMFLNPIYVRICHCLMNFPERKSNKIGKPTRAPPGPLSVHLPPPPHHGPPPPPPPPPPPCLLPPPVTPLPSPLPSPLSGGIPPAAAEGEREFKDRVPPRPSPAPRLLTVTLRNLPPLRCNY